VSGVGGLDVQGHEFHRRVHAAGLEEAPGQRVVEGLVQLAVDQAVDQLLVAAADRRPQRAVMGVLLQGRFQPQHALGDALVVQFDALHRVLARGRPVARLEAQFGAPGDVGEARVVVGEGVTDDVRQSLCGIHGSFRCPVRPFPA
jgi:hypothetical protein